MNVLEKEDTDLFSGICGICHRERIITKKANMVPKFRGNSEDWLDDEKAVRRGAKKASSARLVTPLSPEEANGTVAEVFPNQCRVRLDEGGAKPLCAYRRALVIGDTQDGIRDRTPVAVGDRVKVVSNSRDSGVIEGVALRRNFLSRPAPGREVRDGKQDGEEATKFRHVIAANIDLVVIVASVDEPAFSPGLVDRFLVASAAAGIEVLICVSKSDLAARVASSGQERPWRLYSDIGYDVLEVSAVCLQHIDELRCRIRGKQVVFCGQSGVGKTSLLRALLTADIGRVNEISASTGRGRHTTTSAVLLDSGWIDTPGVREFGIFDVLPEELATCFPEFAALKCAVSGCLHLDEPGCGATSLARYASYRRILESVVAGQG